MSVGAVGSTTNDNYLTRMMMNSISRASKAEGQAPDFSKIASNIVKKEDSDGDGKISTSETRLNSESFTKFDTDADGLLSETELATGIQSNPPRGMRPPVDLDAIAAKILEREDANGDGSISADESALDAERFGNFDTDGNGALSVEELQAGLEANKPEPPQTEATAINQETDLLGSLLELLSQNDGKSSYATQTQGWGTSLIAQNYAVSA